MPCRHQVARARHGFHECGHILHRTVDVDFMPVMDGGEVTVRKGFGVGCIIRQNTRNRRHQTQCCSGERLHLLCPRLPCVLKVSASVHLHCQVTVCSLRGFGWRIHCGVEATELSTNKQHTLTFEKLLRARLLSMSCIFFVSFFYV